MHEDHQLDKAQLAAWVNQAAKWLSGTSGFARRMQFGHSHRKPSFPEEDPFDRSTLGRLRTGADERLAWSKNYSPAEMLKG
jgi:hypothetical protein